MRLRSGPSIEISGSRSGQIAIKRGGRNPEAVRDLSHADVGIGQHRLGVLDVIIGEFRLSASCAARAPSSGEARLGALADQAALEFRQRTKHMKNQPPSGSRRVEGFGQTAKPDAPHPQASMVSITVS